MSNSSYWRDFKFIDEQRQGSELIDKVLEPYKERMQDDYIRYRNHCQRVFTFTMYFMAEPIDSSHATNEISKVSIAVAFHDIGIWSHNTVDYIDPSRQEAEQYIKNNIPVDKQAEWAKDIDIMIERHHQILASDLPEISPIAEAFRKADLVDFSLGFIRSELPLEVMRAVLASYANEGFHYRLVQLAAAWFIRNPFNPAPMMRLY